MQTLLYGLWTVAGLYGGFVQYPFWWTVFVFSLVALGLFFLTRPGEMEVVRERGVSYALVIIAGNVAFAAVTVLIGRLLGWAFA